MRDTELRQERNEAVYEMYLKGLRTQHFRSMDEAADWVRSQPAPKFYISSRSLVNYIGAIALGKEPKNLHKTTKEKVSILYAMYREFIETNPDCRMPREHICEILVDQPAPKFFISHDYALLIILKERNRHMEMLDKRNR